MKTTVITKPKVKISQKLLDEINAQTQSEGQVILHFIFLNMRPWPTKYRIWPSTFLYANDSEHTSSLVHAERISLFPTWTDVPPLTETFFTLIFSRLPKDCDSFDFVEECNGQGGEFVVRGIRRNESDVYYLQID